MADKKNFNIEDFINKEITGELLEKLLIAGRIQHVLGPTSTSAVSTPEETPPSELDLGLGSDPTHSTDNILKEVQELEDLVEQLEEANDELLKDMAIPPANDIIADAAKQLGSPDGTITKDIFDKALAVMDYYPMMYLGTDPVLAALNGDGEITGDWMQCNQITSNLAKSLKVKPKVNQPVEVPIQNLAQKELERHQLRMDELLVETLNMLWWNRLWPSLIVDLTICNPIRSIVTPIDRIIMFFKKWRFKIFSDTELQENNGKYEGPLNFKVNKLRNWLICLPIRAKWYLQYQPPPGFDCVSADCTKQPFKIKEISSTDANKKPFDKITAMLDAAEDNGCLNNSDIAFFKPKNPKGFGTSPTCIQAAQTVASAVLEDALTPAGPTTFNKVLQQSLDNTFSFAGE